MILTYYGFPYIRIRIEISMENCINGQYIPLLELKGMLCCCQLDTFTEQNMNLCHTNRSTHRPNTSNCT